MELGHRFRAVFVLQQESMGKCCGVSISATPVHAAVQPEPSQIPPDASSVVLVPDIYIFLLAVHSAHSSPASTSGGGAMAMDPNRSPTDSWKGPARQQRRSLSLDKRSPKPRPLGLMQSMETCTGCFFVEGEAVCGFFFYAAGCVLSCCAANRAAGLF